MGCLSLSLLGPIKVCLDGELATGFRYDKVRALLFYLAVESECAHSREELIGLLWPDLPEEAARTNLRQALASLRGAIGDRSADPPYLLISRENVQWNEAANARLDVADLVELLSASSRHVHRNPSHCKPCAQRLAQAVKLYRGHFMEHFFLADSAAFEEWAALKREGLQRRVLDALARLAGYHERRGEYEQAEAYTRRQLELEPWGEEAHRQLMRLLVLSDKRSAALAHYEQCRHVLAQELGVEPEPETTALYEQIRNPDWHAPASAERLVPPAERPHNLPPHMTPFIGREEELARIAALLDDPACRLVTLVGAGGIGKTRLALQAAVEQVESFSHGAYFVSLASQSSPEMVPSAIATAVHAPLSHKGPVDAQLLAYLHDKEMLLVLDNFEHLLAGSEFLVRILAGAPEVTLLVTSRERLKLQSEWVVEIEGLPFPQTSEGEPAEGLAAVELFVQSARRGHSSFVLSGGERAQAARICRMLDGVPLAIELAAAWTRMLSCEEIAREIEKGLDLLVGSLRDLPARHHSLRAVFDHSWELLTEEEQAAFRKLALFRGGFQREAAEQVAGGTLPLLGALLDKSLLRRNGLGWYELHELARQYAYEQLVKSGEVDQVRDRHLAYFLGLAETAAPELKGAQGAAWLARLERENDNLRAALQWALDHHEAEQALRLAGGLWQFWSTRGYMSEGRHWLQQALNFRSHILDPAAADSSQLQNLKSLVARALNAAGVLARMQSDYAQSLVLHEESLALLREQSDRSGIAHTLNHLGTVAFHEGDYAQALISFQESLALHQALGNPAGTARAFGGLGNVAFAQGDCQRARQMYEESLALDQKLANTAGMSTALSNLGLVALQQRDYERATTLLEKALALERDLNNKRSIALTLINLGDVGRYQADYSRARASFVESLQLFRELGDREGIASALEGLAGVAVAQGQSDRAARLCGAAEALREALHAPLSPAFRTHYDATLAGARAHLGDEQFMAAQAEGRAMSLEQTIEWVLQADVSEALQF